VGGDALPVVGQLRGRFAVVECALQGADELGVLRGFKQAFGFECVAQVALGQVVLVHLTP
jgi:hypothetical protein